MQMVRRGRNMSQLSLDLFMEVSIVLLVCPCTYNLMKIIPGLFSYVSKVFLFKILNLQFFSSGRFE